MKVFYKIVASGVDISLCTYEILLKNLLAAGNWRKYVEVPSSLNVCLAFDILSQSDKVFVDRRIAKC